MAYETVSQQRKRLGRSKGECTVCGQQMPPRRRTYCSDECWLLNDWGAARHEALNRDKCICQICGFDSNALRNVWRHLKWAERQHLSKRLRAQGFNRFSRSYGAGLQVDHIVPRAEGGTNALHNLRTLCEPCHKRRTREWHKKRKQEKNDEARSLFV